MLAVMSLALLSANFWCMSTIYLFVAGTLPTEWGQMSLSALGLSFNELTGDLDKTDVY